MLALIATIVVPSPAGSSGQPTDARASTVATTTPGSGTPVLVAPLAEARTVAWSAVRDAAPARAPRPVLVASVTRATALSLTPGGAPIATVQTRTPFGSPSTVLVTRRRGRWLGVISEQAGNNRTGWILASAATLHRVDWELDADLGHHQLTVLHDGRAVKRYTIAIGRSVSPTPTGHFAVTDLLSTGDPTGPYGCCIVALSANAPHPVPNWNGGLRIAIHAGPDPDGPVAATHGCMHVTAEEGRWLLRHIPLGTPVVVSG